MATTRTRRVTPDRVSLAQANKMVAEQVAWIAAHGGTLIGYVARYGSADDVDHYGAGGEAIYKADTDALAEYRKVQASARARAERATSRKAARSAPADTIPPATAATITRRQALAILDDAGGHAWLTVDAGRKIAAAFGFPIEPHRQRANTGEHKSLMVPNVAPGTMVSGYSCVTLAETIAERLADAHDARPGATPLARVYRMQEGRGSRGRSACETIAAALDAAGE